MEMVIKLDKQGRIVIPKEIRDKYQFTQEEEIILSEQPTGVLLTRKKSKKSLKEIFKHASTVDLEHALTLDVANYDEDEL